MRAICVWRKDTDYARETEEWLEDFQYQTGREIEKLDPDTVEGEIFCSTYDVVEYPTLAVTDDEGKMAAQWRGVPLPLISEVLYFIKDN